jgi:hypothetical protein
MSKMHSRGAMNLSAVLCVSGIWSNMDAKNIIYGETALDTLIQWLRATGEPQDIEHLLERYLDILRTLVLEEKT